MDLGLSTSPDFFTPSGFSPEEISALINPENVRPIRPQNAIQTLLNQGAEYLSRKAPFALEHVLTAWQSYLHVKSEKILSLTPSLVADKSCQNPLVCSFNIGSVDKGFIAFDWRLSYVLIDALLGGINGVSIEKRQDEPYSEIEKNILYPVFYHLLDLLAEDRNITIHASELSTAFPLESPQHTRFTFLARTPTMSGKIFLSIPSNLLPSTEKENLFTDNNLLQTLPIETQAVINGYQTTLADMLAWTVGTELTLGTSDQMSIDLNVNHKTIACAKPDGSNATKRQVIVESTL